MVLDSNLCRDPDEQQPLLLGVSAVVDDLTACQAGVPVEDFDWLGVPLHAPMVDCVVGHKCHCVEGDPLPKGDVVRHGVGLHLALHLNVKDLKGFGGCGGRGAHIGGFVMAAFREPSRHTLSLSDTGQNHREPQTHIHVRLRGRESKYQIPLE